jgi:hypothetical protein
LHGDGKTESQQAAIPLAADSGIAFIPVIAELLDEDQWVEFRLVNSKNEPIANQAFILTGPSGESIEGYLDAEGFARVEPVKPGKCTVFFPELDYTIAVEA